MMMKYLARLDRVSLSREIKKSLSRLGFFAIVCYVNVFAISREEKNRRRV